MCSEKQVGRFRMKHCDLDRRWESLLATPIGRIIEIDSTRGYDPIHMMNDRMSSFAATHHVRRKFCIVAAHTWRYAASTSEVCCRRVQGEGAAPLRWVKFECRFPCIAKMLVIARMLQMSNAEVEEDDTAGAEGDASSSGSAPFAPSVADSSPADTMIDDVMDVWYSTT
jgi:hypothetical protein